MDYDHGKKAGNQGDVVKHVALAAALRQLLLNWGDQEFSYADTFTAYAWNTLHPNGEWRQGVGKLNVSKSRDHDVNWLIETYGLDDAAADKKYPGSARIAYDAALAFQKSPVLNLWDIADEPIASLSAEFGGHSIFQRPATHIDREIVQADFLFIDPPDKSFWDDAILPMLQNRPNGQSVLVWLPIGVNTTTSPPGEDKKSAECRETAISLGYHVTKVRWAVGGRTIGCQLIYNLPGIVGRRVRTAVEEVFKMMRWNETESPVVRIEHYLK